MKREIYFTGYLASARTANSELDQIANSHFNDYLAGRAFLVQRKVGNQYEYIRIDSRDLSDGNIR